MFSRAVDKRVKAGMQMDDAEADFLADLLQTCNKKPTDVLGIGIVVHRVRDKDGKSIVHNSIAARVLVDTPKFRSKLNQLVTRGDFSRQTYDSQVRPWVNDMATALAGPAGESASFLQLIC